MPTFNKDSTIELYWIFKLLHKFCLMFSHLWTNLKIYVNSTVDSLKQRPRVSRGSILCIYDSINIPSKQMNAAKVMRSFITKSSVSFLSRFFHMQNSFINFDFFNLDTRVLNRKRKILRGNIPSFHLSFQDICGCSIAEVHQFSRSPGNSRCFRLPALPRFKLRLYVLHSKWSFALGCFLFHFHPSHWS